MSEFTTGGEHGPEVFGIPAQPAAWAVVEAEHLASAMKDAEGNSRSFLPPGMNYRLFATVVEVGPLLEDVRHGRPVPREAVRPHAGALLDNVATNGYVIDKVEEVDEPAAALLRRVAPKRDWPIVRQVAKAKVEEQFPERARQFLESEAVKEKVRVGLEKAAPFVDVVAEFENPKERLVEELAVVAGGIRGEAEERRNKRVKTIEAEQPKGLRARVSRWMRKRRASKVTTEDVAHGIEQIRQEVLEDDPATPTPMLRAIIDTALAETGRAREDVEELPTLYKRSRLLRRTLKIEPLQYLDATAPEILKTLDAPLRESGQDNPRFLRKLKSSPIRKLSRLKPIAVRGKLRFWGGHLLRDVRDALPASGEELRSIPERMQEFFQLDV
jgi:hypothetical protein